MNVLVLEEKNGVVGSEQVETLLKRVREVDNLLSKMDSRLVVTTFGVRINIAHLKGQLFLLKWNLMNWRDHIGGRSLSDEVLRVIYNRHIKSVNSYLTEFNKSLKDGAYLI